MKIEIGHEYIAIKEDNVEIVGWSMQEWAEDPEVVYSIANAISLAYEDPEGLKHLLSK